MSDTRSERRKMKEMKVFELYNKGMTSRKIASLVHLSLRDVTRFVKLAADKTRTPSTTSIHDLIILEYQVNLLRPQAKELKLLKENLKNEMNELRAEKFDTQNQISIKQSQLDAVKRELEYERFSKEILTDLFNE